VTAERVGVDSLSVLQEAIATVPIPAAPPRLSRDGAAVGLGFLDAALRLNHVRRLTERLTITQHRLAQRSTEVDISINMLTDIQLEAARAYQTLASHRPTESQPDEHSETTLWVPISRLSRTSVGPIEVHDASGRRLPRLTQYETSRLIAWGLYRLLRGILISDQDAQNAETDLGALLFRVHEPRWLIQSAILTVLTEGSKPQTTVDSVGLEARIARAASDPYRQMALTVFDRYRHLLDDYIQLFDFAVNDYIVVVALDSSFDEHLLTYESPLYVTDRDSWTAQVWRLIRANREGYYVSYRTDIPSTLRSYHLVAEAAQGVDISKIFLSTNARENEVTALSKDLSFVAERLQHSSVSAGKDSIRKTLDLELQTLLRQLSELMRRTRWEASTAGVHVPEKCVTVCNQLVQTAYEHEVESSNVPPADKPLLTNPAMTPTRLRQAATEITDSQLQYDIALEAQPTTNRAHVYWRRPPPSPLGTGRTHIRSGMLLRNTAESSTRMVVIYALMVAAIVYAVACFLTKSPWPYSSWADQVYSSLTNREAIIAVLLLVPGFLYTRLSLPQRHSVAGHLRTIPRLVAYLCIASIVTLSADVAASSIGWLTRLIFIAGSAIPAASTLLLLLLGSQQPGTAQTLARLDAPAWITCEDAGNVGRLKPDAEFSSTRSAR
jgi:hypothetical protein